LILGGLLLYDKYDTQRILTPVLLATPAPPPAPAAAPLLIGSQLTLDILGLKFGAPFGYIDPASGRPVTPLQWDRAERFSEGFAHVSAPGKNGFIDSKGTFVIGHAFSDRFREGLSEIMLPGDKYGFINSSAQIVIPPAWDYVGDFSGGVCHVRRDHLWGLIDRTGKVIAQPEWDTMYSFYDGIALIYRGKSFGLINIAGQVVLPPGGPLEADWNGHFADGRCPVFQNFHSGYVDRTGKIAIPVQWSGAHTFSEGLAAVQSEQKWGYIDPDGKAVISRQWENAEEFSEGLAAVSLKKDEWGYIDKKGTVVIPYTAWTKAKRFTGGLAIVTRSDGKSGLIDQQGQTVVPFEWDGIQAEPRSDAPKAPVDYLLYQRTTPGRCLAAYYRAGDRREIWRSEIRLDEEK